jgi:hypothetical protein
MDTRIQDNNTNHRGSFLMGLITGSAIGAGLAREVVRSARQVEQFAKASKTDHSTARS